MSGHLGDARLALEALLGRLRLPQALLQGAQQRLEQPTPRVALGLALRGIASSAIDVSDGLLGDLGHVLRASGTGATVDASIAITLIAACADSESAKCQFDLDFLRQCALAGGDDYELLFTAPAALRSAVAQAAQACGTAVTRIGRIEAEPGLRLVDAPVLANGRIESLWLLREQSVSETLHRYGNVLPTPEQLAAACVDCAR